MPTTALRILAACAAAALAAGCVAVPGETYYESRTYYPPGPPVTVYEQPGYIYSSPRFYPVPYPVYTPPPPPPPRYGWRDRDDWRRDADRREADRREGERRREADRRREQAERDRNAQQPQPPAPRGLPPGFVMQQDRNPRPDFQR